MRRRDFLAGAAVGAVGLVTGIPATAQETSNIAKQAFAFGYPLVLMDLTREAMTGGANGGGGANQFVHLSGFPTSQFTAMVCPVTDALHSSAWLNVKQGPVVVSIPNQGTRFCTGSFFHAWHDVLARIGTSVNGGKATDYLVTGPGWAGDVPKGLVHVASPTNMVWAPVWISVAGEADLPAAIELQSQLTVTPLSEWKGPRPSQPPGGGTIGAISGLLGSFFKPAAPGNAPPAGGPGTPLAPPPVMVEPGREEGMAGLQDGVAGGDGLAPPMPAEVADAAGDGGAPQAASATRRPGGQGRGQSPAMTPDADGNAPAMAANADGSPGAAPGLEGGAEPPSLGEEGGAGGGGTGSFGSSPNAQLFSMDAQTFYSRLCQLMVDNPPRPEDAAFVAKMAKIGLTPGATINLAGMNRASQIAFLAGVRNAGQRIFSTRSGLKMVSANRWETALNCSDFETSYDRRAYATLMYFGASQPEDVLCPRISKDATSKPLNGSQRYAVKFASGQLPPVTHSWALSVYRAPIMELVDNPSGKYGVNSDSPLVTGPDGSVTIYLQRENPGPDKEANWIPTPEGPFELMLRLRGPKPEVAALQWKPPVVGKG